MTTPAQPPQQQQPPPGLTSQIAAALAVSTTVAAAMAVLTAPLAALRLNRAAMQGALTIVMAFPPARAGVMGPASRITEGLNLMRRAQFAANAAWRINTAVEQARSQGASPVTAFEQQLAAERGYYSQHLGAIWSRDMAAARVDSSAMDYGLLLGWYTHRDKKTSAECLAADRHNFYADAIPVIGYPGGVHPNCRCRPGRPFPGAALLPSLMQPADRKAVVYA